jgi:hypothetical protein
VLNVAWSYGFLAVHGYNLEQRVLTPLVGLPISALLGYFGFSLLTNRKGISEYIYEKTARDWEAMGLNYRRASPYWSWRLGVGIVLVVLSAFVALIAIGTLFEIHL